MLGNEKMDQEDGFTYLGSITGKNDECNEDTKIRIAKAQDVYFTVTNFGGIGR